MPAKTARQQRFMGADYNRAKKGRKTKTGMPRTELKEFARKPEGGYPGKKKKSKKG